MRQTLFFETLTAQWEQKLPFVVYRKPNSDRFKAILQSDTTLHYTKNYEEAGFVFAPFDNAKEAILLHPDKQLVSEKIVMAKRNKRDITKAVKEKIDITAKTTHIALVEKALQLLTQQDLTKVVLSREEKIKIVTQDFLEKFQDLATLYPTAMVYCWYHPKVGLWLGATPETLLYMQKDSLHTMALAGTQPYKDTEDVAWGKKELEEQQLVTDSIREELAPLVGTMTISDVYTHRAGALLHLRTDVKATVSKISLKELLDALHPTPAVCGLPKEAAKRFILTNENYNREFYTGFFGELHLIDGDDPKKVPVTNLYVNLRCMQVKDQETVLYVGGGITKASDAQKEWEETVKKTNTMKSVL